MRARRPSLLAAAAVSVTAMVIGMASAQGVVPPAPLGESQRPYWYDGWRGWHFYEDPPSEEPAPTARPAPAIPPLPTAP